VPSLDRDALVLQVRKELIETGTTSGQWDDTEIIEFLQEANEAITELAELEAIGNTVTVAGVETVDYPSGIARVSGIWCRKSGSTENWTKLRKASVDERLPDTGTATNRGMPSAYLIFAGKIYLLPIPDGVYDLNVFGHAAASNMVSGNVAPSFDSKFHPVLKNYAVARCKQKVDDPGYANYDANYQAGILGFRVWKLQQENHEGPRVVKIAEGMWD